MNPRPDECLSLIPECDYVNEEFRGTVAEVSPLQERFRAGEIGTGPWVGKKLARMHYSETGGGRALLRLYWLSIMKANL